MKTILCANHQRDSIYHNLVLASNGKGIGGLNITSLSNLIYSYEEDRVKILFDARKLLLTNKDSFPIYATNLGYLSFIEEVLSFLRTCILHGVDLQNLPEDTQANKQLKQIVLLLSSLPLKEKEVIKTYKDKLEKISSEEVELYDYFEKDYFLYKLRNNLSVKKVKTKKNKPTKKLYYASSQRRELEGIAQYIVDNPKSCNIILCDYQNTFPVLAQVFSRYKIPFTSISNTIYTKTPGIYIDIINYALDPSDDNKDKLKDIDISSLSLTTPKDVAISAYHILKDCVDLANDNELKAGLMLRSILNQAIPNLETMDDLNFLVEQIQSITVTGDELVSDFCMVTDLTHDVSKKDVSFVVGCTSRNYPRVSSLKGIFDEEYVLKVEGFPTLEERHNAYISQLEWIDGSGEAIYYSYPTNDYQGRESTLAYDVEVMFTKDGTVHQSPWPILELNAYERKIEDLPSEFAQKIFLKEDGRVHSSISRIERYFNCPYSYFLQSGLKIKEPEKDFLNNANIGTIQHSFMEESRDTILTNEEVEEVLNPYFEELKDDKDYYLYNLTKQRMVNSLVVASNILSEANTVSLFKQSNAEYKYSQDFSDHVHLNGIIDRIDETSSQIRIIDYKSSNKDLSETKVRQGLQLQLLTYILIAEKIFKKEPDGVYYYSLNNKSIDIKAGSFGKSKGITLTDLDDESLHNNVLKERRFSGWSFNSAKDKDEDVYFKRNLYDIDLVRQCLNELYEHFYNSLIIGKIDLDPIEGACTYCPYKPICRFDGLAKDPTPIVETSLKKGKDVKDES